jgi:SRSO17 transposase
VFRLGESVMSMDAAAVSGWAEKFGELCRRVATCFGRRDLRRRAEGYVHGLLGRVDRKNMWQLAEYLGDETPHGLQRLLDRAVWSADDVRGVLVGYAREHLLAEDEPGVLVVDETGFLKKGVKSAGVQRQYSGTAGRIGNCQIGVFLALAGSGGRTLIDRELYLPKTWCDDAGQREEASIPSGVRFATKPQLARRMITRARSAGLRPTWVLADEAYGSDSKFRRFLESKKQPYVVCIRCDLLLWTESAGRQRVDRIVAEKPASEWFRHSVGDGATGPRLYDWTAQRFGSPTDDGRVHWLLARRSIAKPDEYAYYFCFAPPDATARDLAVAAGQRWAVECCFETAKQETGLDEYEVRSWHGWYRHITLSMLAMAFLAATRTEADAAEKNAVTQKRATGSSR